MMEIRRFSKNLPIFFFPISPFLHELKLFVVKNKDFASSCAEAPGSLRFWRIFLMLREAKQFRFQIYKLNRNIGKFLFVYLRERDLNLLAALRPVIRKVQPLCVKLCAPVSLCSILRRSLERNFDLAVDR